MLQTKPPYRVSLVAFLILFETVPYHKKSINAMIPSKSQFSTLIVAHLSNKRNLLFPWKIARRFRFNKNTLWPNDDPSSATLLRLVNTSLFRKSCGRLMGEFWQQPPHRFYAKIQEMFRVSLLKYICLVFQRTPVIKGEDMPGIGGVVM